MDIVGERIRELRLKKGLTLKDMSELTGLSQGFLSLVERSKSSVTLQSISKISEALGVSRTYFFEETVPVTSDRKLPITKKNPSEEAKRGLPNEFTSTSFFYQSLNRIEDSPLFEPMLVVILPDEQKSEPSTHNGQEFGYILEGNLSLILEDKEYLLEKGDSFHIKSNTPHTWYNGTKEIVKIIYVFAN